MSNDDLSKDGDLMSDLTGMSRKERQLGTLSTDSIKNFVITLYLLSVVILVLYIDYLFLQHAPPIIESTVSRILVN